MKKNIAIVILVLALAWSLLGNIGQSQEAVKTKAAQLHAEQCWDMSADKVEQLVELYTLVLEYNNAGYQLDDYSAGSLNTNVATYNAGNVPYNKQCAGGQDDTPTLQI